MQRQRNTIAGIQPISFQQAASAFFYIEALLARQGAP
jgi:hypothetical protein